MYVLVWNGFIQLGHLKILTMQQMFHALAKHGGGL